MFESLSSNILFFLAATAVITVVGTKLAKTADQLADRTGLGEAVVGALLLGGSTSLPGIVTSVSAAWSGYPQLAIANAIGGIAVQTAFLAIADLVYSKANLEHSAASAANLLQGSLLVMLLAIPLVAAGNREVELFSIHPASILMLAAYIFGLRLVRKTKSNPMWKPLQTTQTLVDKPDRNAATGNLPKMLLRFFLFAGLIGFAGYIVSRTGIAISRQTGLSETIVGALFTAIATSLPELVTSIAAVRQNSLTLAVGGIIGGNSFDVLFIAFSDAAYQDGSIYHAINDSHIASISLTIVMTGILLMGLLRREKYGPVNIGFESFLILLIYISGNVLMFF